MFQRIFLVLICLGFVSLSAAPKKKNSFFFAEQYSFTSLHHAVVSEQLDQVKLIIERYRLYDSLLKSKKGQVPDSFATSLMKITSCGRTAEDLAKDLNLEEIFQYLKFIREEAGIAASDYSAVEDPVCCW